MGVEITLLTRHSLGFPVLSNWWTAPRLLARWHHRTLDAFVVQSVLRLQAQAPALALVLGPLLIGMLVWLLLDMRLWLSGDGGMSGVILVLLAFAFAYALRRAAILRASEWMLSLPVAAWMRGGALLVALATWLRWPLLALVLIGAWTGVIGAVTALLTGVTLVLLMMVVANGHWWALATAAGLMSLLAWGGIVPIAVAAIGGVALMTGTSARCVSARARPWVWPMPWAIVRGVFGVDILGGWVRLAALALVLGLAFAAGQTQPPAWRLALVVVTVAGASVIAGGWVHAVQRWRQQRGAWLAALPISRARWSQLEIAPPSMAISLVVLPLLPGLSWDQVLRLPLVLLVLAIGVFIQLRLVAHYHQGTVLGALGWVVVATPILRWCR